MECERLQRLVKSWYMQVQDESMAPARMVSFMEKHLGECAVCLADPLVSREIGKITAIILPPTKIRKPSDDDEEEDAAAGPEEETEGARVDDDMPGEEEYSIVEDDEALTVDVEEDLGEDDEG